mmetsp:Transcript_124225/g.215326  ORF Transcript_124225/g.215326 Transcript_124225/m.215326 type:complete len:350 (-) Transcript_124225:223-1272(-)
MPFLVALTLLLWLAQCWAFEGNKNPCKASDMTSILQEPGSWQMKPGYTPVWEPKSCYIPMLSYRLTEQCLERKSVAILGDSTSRRLFKCMMYYVTKKQVKGKDTIQHKNPQNALFCYCHIRPKMGSFRFEYSYKATKSKVNLDWYWQDEWSNWNETGQHLQRVYMGKYDIIIWMGGYWNYVMSYTLPPNSTDVQLDTSKWAEDFRTMQQFRKQKPGSKLIVVGMGAPHFWQTDREHIWKTIDWPKAILRMNEIQARDVQALGGIFIPLWTMTSAVRGKWQKEWMFDWIHYRGEVVVMVARSVLHAMCPVTSVSLDNYQPKMPIKSCMNTYKQKSDAEWFDTNNPNFKPK